MTERLTVREALVAMQRFLEGVYERTHSDDIGALLGQIQLNRDGTTWDPAAWTDWLDAVESAAGGSGPPPATPE